MSIESSSNGQPQTQLEVLTQETLQRGIDDELVIEIVDYDFYLPGKKGKEYIPERTFEMESDGVVHIESSPLEGKTHKIAINNIPLENNGLIYLLGFSQKDFSRREEAREAINGEFSEDGDRLVEEYSRQLEIHGQSFRPGQLGGLNTWEDFRRYNEKSEQMSEEQRRKREILLANANEKDEEAKKIEADVKLDIAFAPTVIDVKSGKADVEFNLKIDHETGSLFIPLKPIPFEAFKNREFLQLFLATMSKDKESVEKWTEYFAVNKDIFPVQAKFAIQSKLLTIKGK